MEKNNNSAIDLSTKQIKDLYNIYKQVKAKDLPQLAKTYKDNPKILVVLMKIKNKRPTITLSDLMKEIKSVKDDVKSVKADVKSLKSDIAKINIRIDNLETLVITQFKQHGWIK